MRTLLALLFLAGCGSGGDQPAPDNHGYGFAYDVQADGIKLRYTPALKTGDQYSQINYYEAEFASVEQCTGLSAPLPPFIIFDGSLADVGGYYYSSPSLIVVKYGAAVRHEYVHYLLDVNTGDLDRSHTSPLFKACS